MDCFNRLDLVSRSVKEKGFVSRSTDFVREVDILVPAVYLANLRLKEVGTDLLITAYESILINPLSESASSVGAGLAAPAAEFGRMLMLEVFKLAVSSFKVNDWGLFGNATDCIYYDGAFSLNKNLLDAWKGMVSPFKTVYEAVGADSRFQA
ncbi:hypothetical protein RHSIM_Rhsim11G0057700 [Rhododendron simsii]|uniref:Uncharacterized protein n=1 Tax=Rhododendron simsii TaxID=118357 RepID=A0A834LBA6_RHOSS|nr:hypothetical protein RHSIM_Rhsim11G0057700 [Rhododendron simsii]